MNPERAMPTAINLWMPPLGGGRLGLARRSRGAQNTADTQGATDEAKPPLSSDCYRLIGNKTDSLRKNELSRSRLAKSSETAGILY